MLQWHQSDAVMGGGDTELCGIHPTWPGFGARVSCVTLIACAFSTPLLRHGPHVAHATAVHFAPEDLFHSA